MSQDSTSGRAKILFLDWRDIECGGLHWQTPDGTRYGVGRAPEPEAPLRAEPDGVPHGIALRAMPARKTDSVDDWKGWGRIIHDGGAYRSWYFEINGHSKLGSGSPAHAKPPESVVIVGVTSADGFAWRETSRCQIHPPPQRGFDGLTFFIDPAAPPAERYRFVWCSSVETQQVRAELEAYFARHPTQRDVRMSDKHVMAMYSAVSGDGEHWSADPRPLLLHMSDTDSTMFHDADLGRYVFYTRMFREGRRWIGRAEAEDIHRWGPIVPIIWPRLDDPPDYDFYLNGYTRYPGLPEYQLMFPMVYHRFTERSDVRLYSSADGVAWNQAPGGPVIVPGDPGAWDSEFLGSGKDLVPFSAGRIAAPYSGTPYPHKYPRGPEVWKAWRMGWAWWPMDRLCGLCAERQGEFWTAPIKPAGRRVRLNVRTHRAGSVRVSVVGVAGRGLEDCTPIFGDHAGAPVTWKGSDDLGAAQGQAIVLRFQMRCAELYSVSFV